MGFMVLIILTRIASSILLFTIYISSGLLVTISFSVIIRLILVRAFIARGMTGMTITMRVKTTHMFYFFYSGVLLFMSILSTDKREKAQTFT
jgi:hypothetical protein